MAADATKAAEKVAEMKKLATEAAQVGSAQVGMAQAKKAMDGGALQARFAMEKGMEQATKTAEGFFRAAEEAAEFGRGNLEAVTRSAQLWTAGAQDLARQYMAVAQGLTDHALEGAKALAAVKSLQEAANVQSSYAKAALERAVSESAKLQEATFKLAEQAYAPLTARVTVAMEKLGKPLAA
jgi:phasin family protein